MRLVTICICAVMLACACSGKKSVAKTETANEPAKPAPAEVKKNAEKVSVVEGFLARFEQAAMLHDRVTVMDMMDKEYKKERHETVLKGNTEQFLNDLSCGYQTNGQGSKCVKFNEIVSMARVELLPNNGNYTAVYHVSDKVSTVKVYWLVTVKKEAGNTVLGLYAFH